MNKNILIVGAALALAVVVSLPVAALVAGLRAGFTTLAFWPTFAYAAIGCGVLNVMAALRNIAKINAAANS